MALQGWYERPVLLDRERHRRRRVQPAGGFAFARRAHSLVLAAAEFNEACKEYAIVFTRSPAGKVVPVAMLGLRAGDNLFVGEDGRWDARYVPAFVRRYPFVLANDAEAQRTTRYPVLYLFHGANADETAWTRLGRANLILDNLLAEKKALPFIVVMPFGYGVPPHPPGASGNNTAEFAKDLLGDVLPYIESRYRVQADRAHRAIVGLSMGGGQALSIGLNHLETFSHVGGFSSGLGRAADFPTTYATLVADSAAANRQLKLLWIGCGAEDGAMANSRALSEFLTARGIKHTFHESGGAHTWIVWRRYLREVAPLLFRS